MTASLRVALALLLVVPACGGGDEATTSTAQVATTTPSATTFTTAVTTTTSPALATTTMGSTTTPAQAIDVHIEGGQVVGPDNFSFSVGDQVSIWVLSDADAEVHVHGYDVTFQAKSDVPVEIALTADVPGIFEVELEDSHTLLFELVVTS